MADDDEVHAYETSVGVVCVGVPVGQKRPAIWLVRPEGPYILGRLAGSLEQRALVFLLDAAFDDINRVIAHYAKPNALNGETPHENDTGTIDGP